MGSATANGQIMQHLLLYYYILKRVTRSQRIDYAGVRPFLEHGTEAAHR